MTIKHRLTKRHAIKESIAHHLRMREWARTQRQDAEPSKREMEHAIGESWFSDDCVLCQKYWCKSEEATIRYCRTKNGRLCPYLLRYGSCNGSRSATGENDNAWFQLSIATSWRSWMKHSDRVIKQLRSLLE